MISKMQCCGRISSSPALALGLAIALAVAVGAVPQAHAQAIQVIYSFGSRLYDGVGPESDLWRSPSGVILSGTTNLGGDFKCGAGKLGCGAVFQLKPNANGTIWTETIMTRFSRLFGENPSGGVIRDKYGDFLGTTLKGGIFGAGTVFVLHPSSDGWGEDVVHDFASQPDGASPQGDLWEDTQGNFYGTTNGGGTANYGSVFKLDATKEHTYSLLYSFASSADGKFPLGGLVQDKSGNFYGTTSNGGSVGNGTIFQLDPTGTTKTILHNFTGTPDGTNPVGALAIDNNGNLYGATHSGGDGICICGIVFELSPPAVKGGAWTESVKYRFTGGADGGEPTGIVRDSNGNLFGTTTAGGSTPPGYGTVFEVDLGGSETVLWSFTNGADGGAPVGNVILDAHQKYVYGTARDGGANSAGVVFRIAVP